tara:strand:+ start:245 stop:1351 length:1107 start_codon:yes stop_codon:yes gene_type:complete
MKIRGKLIFLILVITVIMCSGALAALNVSMSDQGSGVKNSTADLLPLGNLEVTIWDDISSGTLIYNETFANAITNGSWSVVLGENASNNLSLEFNKIYYKDYKIAGEDANFTNHTGSSVGRKMFFSPLGHIGTSDILAGNITGSLLASGAIGSTHIGLNSVLSAGIAALNITAGKIAPGAISAADIGADAINASHISDLANLSLGESITFTLGEVIDNIVNGWIAITGNLNVTDSLVVGGGLNVTGEVETATHAVIGGDLSISGGTYIDTIDMGGAANLSIKNTTSVEIMRITDVGQLLIGATETETSETLLHINGSVVVSGNLTTDTTLFASTSAGACTNDYGGALHFNESDNLFYGCNLSNWVALH